MCSCLRYTCSGHKCRPQERKRGLRPGRIGLGANACGLGVDVRTCGVVLRTCGDGDRRLGAELDRRGAERRPSTLFAVTVRDDIRRLVCESIHDKK
jgi:hypothetical protein